MKGRTLSYYLRNTLPDNEAKALTVADAAREKAMHFANIEFLTRLRAEHQRAGRHVS